MVIKSILGEIMVTTHCSSGPDLLLTSPVGLPSEFYIENWPTQSNAACEALKEMTHTHHVNYIEAFDMHGTLIFPTMYRRYLEGALVQVRFSMSHWADDSDETDSYASDIVSMRVLVPPQRIGPVTPRRKRFYRKDPFTPDITPKKYKIN